MAPSGSGGGNRFSSGAVLSHYRIEEGLGAGGMGVVYRARDTNLNRTVALKIIGGDAADPDLRRRFLKEARAASAISHPNIVTIHEVDSVGDVDFIVMELLPGESLDKRIARDGALPVDDVVAFAIQVAAALAAAHDAGIVHRDIKPANVVVTGGQHVKLLDFGVAKQLTPPAAADAATMTVTEATRPGAVVGSMAYMSPEQAQGRPVDGRSDVFSLGILLYEALTGRRPFGGTTAVETVAKILEATPPSIESVRKDVPGPLVQLVNTCLAKDRNDRPSAAEVRDRLETIGARRAPVRGVLRAVGVAAAIVLAAAAAAGAWWWESGRDAREARRQLPRILQLADADDSYAFYHAAHPFVELLKDDVRFQQAWNNFTFPVPAFNSTPPGAEVLTKGYDRPDEAWISLGRTPLTDPRFPRGTSRVKVVHEGFAPYDGTLTLFATNVVLDPQRSVPDGMTRIPNGSATNEGRTFDVPSFWLDRYEVTNRQFKAFVDAGGYSRREFWKQPFIDAGKTLTFEQAMTRFRDRTGRPGPASWELGTFPSSTDSHPVSGVSWYEAAAYAVFAGKTLPTAFQWTRAGDFAGPSAVFSDILLHSNFGKKGPNAVGATPGVGPFGQYDMAGNVKEWCWNESDTGRMIMGGGWNEPTYTYEDRDAQPPMARLDTYGFRLARSIDPQPEASLAFVPRLMRDYSKERPVDDARFAISRTLYSYDATPFNEKLERTEETAEWRRETVTFDAPYVNDRIILHLYLPKNAAPPYQPVVYFPGGDAQILRSSRQLNLTSIDFVIRSGRALLFPVYQGTYERNVPRTGPGSAREVAVARVKDIRRVVDYVSSRRDLDVQRVSYYGISLGAFYGVLVGPLEPRFKSIVLLSGGFPRVPVTADFDLINFAPRIQTPTLMVNGDSDFQAPVETAQAPMFKWLGPAGDRKRYALFHGGHVPYQFNDVIREILDWFDRFAGPVQTISTNSSN